jgi:hypothetical protein
MVLAQKQIRRPAEQNRGPGYESTQLCPAYFWQRCQKHIMEKTVFSTNVAGKIGYLPAENWNRPMPVNPVLVSTQSGLGTLISDPKPYS